MPCTVTRWLVGNGVHGLNERIEVRALMTGRAFLDDLIRAYAF